MSGTLTMPRSPPGRTLACSSDTSFGLGASYQSRMASPAARIRAPRPASLREERGRVQSRLERVTFRPIGLDNDIKSRTAIPGLPWEGPRRLREQRIAFSSLIPESGDGGDGAGIEHKFGDAGEAFCRMGHRGRTGLRGDRDVGRCHSVSHSEWGGRRDILLLPYLRDRSLGLRDLRVARE